MPPSGIMLPGAPAAMPGSNGMPPSGGGGVGGGGAPPPSGVGPAAAAASACCFASIFYSRWTQSSLNRFNASRTCIGAPSICA
jgi:hypothetical protein